MIVTHRIAPIMAHVSVVDVSVQPDSREVTVTRKHVLYKHALWKRVPWKHAQSSVPAEDLTSEEHVFVQVAGRELNVSFAKNAMGPDAFVLPDGSVIDVNSKPVTRDA